MEPRLISRSTEAPPQFFHSKQVYLQFCLQVLPRFYQLALLLFFHKALPLFYLQVPEQFFQRELRRSYQLVLRLFGQQEPKLYVQLEPPQFFHNIKELAFPRILF